MNTAPPKGEKCFHKLLKKQSLWELQRIYRTMGRPGRRIFPSSAGGDVPGYCLVLAVLPGIQRQGDGEGRALIDFAADREIAAEKAREEAAEKARIEQATGGAGNDSADDRSE